METHSADAPTMNSCWEQENLGVAEYDAISPHIVQIVVLCHRGLFGERCCRKLGWASNLAPPTKNQLWVQILWIEGPN